MFVNLPLVKFKNGMCSPIKLVEWFFLFISSLLGSTQLPRYLPVIHKPHLSLPCPPDMEFTISIISVNELAAVGIVVCPLEWIWLGGRVHITFFFFSKEGLVLQLTSQFFTTILVLAFLGRPG